MVLPDETLKQLADKLSALPSDMEIQIGNLPQALAQADVAIASTGTVTMECAFFGVPTVTLYKTSWITYQIGKRIVKVKWLTMPNILADEEVFPEFVQNAATPENIAARRAGAFAKRTAPQANQKAAGGNCFVPGRTRRERARRSGDFEFV